MEEKEKKTWVKPELEMLDVSATLTTRPCQGGGYWDDWGVFIGGDLVYNCS